MCVLTNYLFIIERERLNIQQEPAQIVLHVKSSEDKPKRVRMKTHTLPVRSGDALSNSVSYLVENMSVVCTADEELVLKETKVSDIFHALVEVKSNVTQTGSRS